MNEFEKVLKVVEENSDLRHLKIDSVEKTVKERHYNLNGYLIFETKEDLGWVTIVDMGDRGGITDICGRCWIDENDSVVFLSNWRSMGESKFKSESQANEYIKSLPKWDKTKYYLKMVDFGPTSGLINCETGDMVSDEICEKILPKHGFERQQEM